MTSKLKMTYSMSVVGLQSGKWYVKEIGASTEAVGCPMIRAGIANVVMLACDLTTPGRPVIGRLASANRTLAGLAAMSRPSRHRFGLAQTSADRPSGRSARRWGPQRACTARRRTLRSRWHIRFTRTCPGSMGRRVMNGQ